MKSRLIIGFIVILVGVELLLRYGLGFCDTVLMQPDPEFEYIAKPNQDRNRFRKHIVYNSFSQRGAEPDSSSVKFIGFGDSVLNGGVLTDEDELGSNILSEKLTAYFKQPVQFLNVSAGSWGPDNCYAYLEKFGDFGADVFILFVSSHDAFDNMNHKPIVDKHPSFPSQQYSLAVVELLDRYLIPEIENYFSPKEKDERTESLGINKKNEESYFNIGFKQFNSYCKDKEISLIIYLHAEKSELINGEYNEQGQLIIDFASKNKLPLIKDLENGLTLEDFRDDIHINADGQKKMAEIVFSYLIKNQYHKVGLTLIDQEDEN
ncbi:hypothetical protein KZP23_02785 [Echinicola marina]|uniref:hypothetical protein n=1 Tax=Echinicola marina TaxID=2859768 RepID=UPI001CF65A95|nr:hypothetical protein [Echinicola marina]UCS93978.1 hypothetical protein KZP23_02785 [Echinicola marina]